MMHTVGSAEFKFIDAHRSFLTLAHQSEEACCGGRNGKCLQRGVAIGNVTHLGEVYAVLTAFKVFLGIVEFYGPVAHLRTGSQLYGFDAVSLMQGEGEPSLALFRLGRQLLLHRLQIIVVQQGCLKSTLVCLHLRYHVAHVDFFVGYSQCQHIKVAVVRHLSGTFHATHLLVGATHRIGSGQGTVMRLSTHEQGVAPSDAFHGILRRDPRTTGIAPACCCGQGYLHLQRVGHVNGLAETGLPGCCHVFDALRHNLGGAEVGIKQVDASYAYLMHP